MEEKHEGAPIHFKVNGYAVRGGNSDIFISVAHLNGVQLFKNLLPYKKILSFKSTPKWKGFIVQGSEHEVSEVVSVYKNNRKIWSTHTS